MESLLESEILCISFNEFSGYPFAIRIPTKLFWLELAQLMNIWSFENVIFARINFFKRFFFCAWCKWYNVMWSKKKSIRFDIMLICIIIIFQNIGVTVKSNRPLRAPTILCYNWKCRDCTQFSVKVCNVILYYGKRF